MRTVKWTQITKHLWQVDDETGARLGFIRRDVSGPETIYISQRQGDPAAEECDTWADALHWIAAPRVELPHVATVPKLVQ